MTEAIVQLDYCHVSKKAGRLPVSFQVAFLMDRGVKTQDGRSLPILRVTLGA
ncbi:hypothetical protein [Marinimicrobium locisalis]|uniref:hypothetical protein n=1 Tax=Marinimicrobium locisalis TaxID=546022 RepID=UPI003221A1DC